MQICCCPVPFVCSQLSRLVCGWWSAFYESQIVGHIHLYFSKNPYALLNIIFLRILSRLDKREIGQ